MSRKTLVLACGMVTVGAIIASGGIPEPDAILYGRVFVGGQQQHPSDGVTVTARVDGIADEVGSYDLGADSSAGDFYVLRLRLESLYDGSDPSGNAAQVGAGQTAHIFVQRGVEPAQHFADFEILDRGILLYRDLGSLGDWNGDRKVVLEDFKQFSGCMQGPDVSSTGPCLAAFDFDSSGHVDLADYRGFQRTFTGD